MSKALRGPPGGFRTGQRNSVPDEVIRIADDFRNIRGSFRVMGLVDIGTQASLVRVASGKYVFLDSYTLRDDVKRAVLELTDDGNAVEAILNLHPFHTVHCAAMHRDFPNAKLYGTERHAERAPDLPWEALRTDHKELHEKYSQDLDFSVPRGVQFVTSNENVHFSSVLAYHRASRTIHVDDTLMFMRFPWRRVSFHPTLRLALEQRAGAAADFRTWAEELAESWRDAENLCAAHTSALTADRMGSRTLHERILKALDLVSGTLDAHTKKFG